MIPLLDLPPREKLPVRRREFLDERWEQALHFLERLRTLLKDHWTQGSFARDSQGDVCEIFKGETFCLAGGAIYVSGIDPPIEEADLHVHVILFLDHVAYQNGYSDVVHFNDHQETEQDGVLLFLDKILAYLRSYGNDSDSDREVVNQGPANPFGPSPLDEGSLRPQ